MMRNEVDEFRKAFFDRVIQEEQARERAIRRKQANCFHRYVPVDAARKPKGSLRALGPVTEPFVALQCVLCEHMIIRCRKPKA